VTERTIAPPRPAARELSAQEEAQRVAAGASAAILVCTLAIGAVTFLGTSDHLPLRVRLDNVAGGGLLMLLLMVPACLFGLWPADAATRRLSRPARLVIFAAGGALAGAIAGAAFAAFWGTPLEGALAGATIGILGGLAGLAGLTWVSRSRGWVIVLSVLAILLVAYGTIQLQSFE